MPSKSWEKTMSIKRIIWWAWLTVCFQITLLGWLSWILGARDIWWIIP